MNINQAVSSIMSSPVYALSPEDKLEAANDVFETYPLHHVIVSEDDKLVGILSKQDLLYFLRPIHPESNEPYLNELRLKNYTIQEVMTKKVRTINADTSIADALEILNENIFHALPVMENGKIRGIVTTHDIVSSLLKTNKKTAIS